MECPKCGYVMDPFDSACPRCARQGSQTTTVIAPTPPPAPDPEVMKTVDQMAPRMQTRLAREVPVRYEPPLGWPLSIALWIALGFQALFIVLVVLEAIGLQISFSSNPHVAVPVLILLGLFPSIRAASLIGMLRCQRWGFFLFLAFIFGPIMLSVMLGSSFTWDGWLNLILAVTIVIFSIAKWDEFE